MKLKMKNRIINKLTAALLALAIIVGMLPALALAAESDPPNWNFLILFVPMDADYEEGGAAKHVKTSISEEEVKTLVGQLAEFESVMLESGVMTPHFTKYVLPTPVTKLSLSTHGPWPNAADIAAYLKNYPGIDLDAYDHVIVYARMDNVTRNYGGLTGGTFDNGATYSFIPADYCLRNWGNTPKRPAYVALHEFLHTMEAHCGYSFDLHEIEADCVPNYPSDEKYKACMLDIILNRIQGEHGSGVLPSVWKLPPTVRREFREMTIPSDVATIGSYQFRNYTNLERVVIPSTVTKINDHAFQFCSSLSRVTLPASISSIEEGTFEQCKALTEITIPPSVTSIGIWAFESCTSLQKIAIPASVTSIGSAAFQHTGLKDVYYGGTEAQWKAIKIGDNNAPLTKAAVHYNSVTPDTTPSAPVASFSDVPSSAYCYNPVSWAVEKGITSGTSAATFSPNTKCTHAQIITFLWRAAGTPDPAGSVALGGVEPDRYYYKAVQWAAEKQLLAGTAFCADAPCTRAAAVEYMWKYAGKPSSGTDFPFTDVSADSAMAVRWALDNKVTSGTSETTFSPDTPCTRAQIVTFLYRVFAK